MRASESRHREARCLVFRIIPVIRRATRATRATRAKRDHLLYFVHIIHIHNELCDAAGPRPRPPRTTKRAVGFSRVFFLRFDKQTFCFVVVVEVHFFPSRRESRFKLQTTSEKLQTKTLLIGNTNRLEIKENTKRPKRKYKQHQLQKIRGRGQPARTAHHSVFAHSTSIPTHEIG